MINKSQNKRIVSIRLSDFSCDPELVQRLLDSDCVDIARVGDRVGKNGVIRKNFIAIWEPTYALEDWNEVIDRLVEKLGGLGRIGQLVGLVSPKHAWLQFDLPAIGSPYVETNRIDAALLRGITSAGLGFEIEVFAFNSKEPTHHPRDAGRHEKKKSGKQRQRITKKS